MKNTLIFLLVKDNKIIGIKKSDKNIILKKYANTDYLIYRYFSFTESENAPPYKKGDSLPFNKPADLILIKRKDPIQEPVLENYTELDYNENDIKNWFSKLNENKIQRVQEVLDGILKDNDVYYRSFHHSFKMYRMRDYSFHMFNALNFLVGQVDTCEFDEVRFQELMEKSELFGLLMKHNMEKMRDTQFTTNQNRPDLWFQDSSALMGSILLLQKTLEAFLQFSKDFVKKEGIFFENRSILKDYEALVIDCYSSLRGLRSSKESSDQIIQAVKNG